MNGSLFKFSNYNRTAKALLSTLLIALISGCGGGGAGGGSQSPDPVVLDLAIAYVKRPIPLNNGVPVQPDARELITFNPGADLWIRDRANSSSPSENITIVHTTDDNGVEGMGDVRDVEASFDGSMLVFSMREPERPGNMDPTWNLWVYDIATKGLKRIITDVNLADQGEDFAPHFMTNGNIIFSSTRQRDSKSVLQGETGINLTSKDRYTTLDEDRNEYASVLHILRIDCTEFDTCSAANLNSLEQASYNLSHDMDPTVLTNGKILFTRWENMGNNSMHLYQSNPDGSEMKLVYGKRSHDTGTPGSTVQFLQPREMEDGRILSILRPFDNTFGGGDIIAIDKDNFTDNNRLITPTVINVGTGQTSLINNNVTTTENTPSPGGRYSSAYPLWDGTNRLLVSWSQCRLTETDVNDVETIVICTPENIAAGLLPEADPLYGLYIFDPADRTQIPVFQPEEGIIYTDVVVAQVRTRPATIPQLAPIADLINDTQPAQSLGLLHIRSVYDRDGVFNSLGLSGEPLTRLNNLANAGNDPDNYISNYGFSLDNRLVAYLANPARFTADERRARFLRIERGVGIPDILNGEDFDIDNDAFGRSAARGMRDLIGYAPIQPDGSVLVKVPANVPLAISIVDKFGRRLPQAPRHQTWIQVRPGEIVTCSGCHINNADTSAIDGIHGHSVEPVGSNRGAPQNNYTYTGTVTTITGNTIGGQISGQTMAQALYGSLCENADEDCRPSFDLVYNNIWDSDATLDYSLEYSAMPAGINIPLNLGNEACYDAPTNVWKSSCRAIINYPDTIQTIWEASRTTTVTCQPEPVAPPGINDPRCAEITMPDLPDIPITVATDHPVDNQCIGCHTLSNPQMRIALNQDPRRNENHMLSYTELTVNTVLTNQLQRNPVTCEGLTEAVLMDDPDNPGNLIPVLVDDPDNPGNLIPLVIPSVQTVTFNNLFSPNGALASSQFFALLDRFGDALTPCQTVDHTAMLSDHEKRLIFEWLDLGAQYFNDPTHPTVILISQ